METWVAVHGEDGRAHDLAIRTRPESTAAEIAARVAAELGLQQPAGGARWALYSHRREAWFGDGETAGAMDLVAGDLLAVSSEAGGGPPREGGADAVVELAFVAGPAVGSHVELGLGEHVIGRAETAAIRVDDPFAAPEHARVTVDGDRVVLTDLGSAEGTRLDGTVLAGSRALKPGQRIGVGGSIIEARSVGEAAVGPADRGGEVAFNRPPRVVRPPGDEVHHLEAPPADPRPTRLPLAGALVPLALGAVTFLFFRSPLTLVFLAMSPLLVIGSYLEGRASGRSEFRRGRRRFLDQLRDLRAALETATAAETARRHEAAPDLRAVALAAHRRDSRLWERRPQDPDFLELRAGVADVVSQHRVEIPGGGSPTLLSEAAAALDPLATQRAVPISLNLADTGPLGVAGPGDAVRDTARWLVLQAAAHESPTNLAICAALPADEIDAWDWLKWLPHTRGQALPFDGPALCAGAAPARELLERLKLLLDARLAETGPFRGSSSRPAYGFVVTILHEDLPLDRAAVTRLLTEGPRVGLAVLWLGSAARDLPNECAAVLEVAAAGPVTITIPATGDVRRGDGSGDRANEAEARQVAMELAPLRDTAGSDVRARLPLKVSLLDALELPPIPSAADIAERWFEDRDGLAATIGAMMSGPMVVDLRRDGPHALVGGTTGAGKSELLQTMVGALAAAHPPGRLNFLLVDYKGGAAFREAADLPHTVGLVTDLDGHLASRVLVSLRAELKRREAILREAGARDLRELERRGGDCPPSLVIVVDEFATLVREVPQFVDGVVDLAQRGRSLGLHLVLATQRPAGVITDSIRANTNLRIALRVADEADSIDVVDVPDAARIPRGNPGRAFARTGHRELAEFQVAFAGAAGDGTAGAARVEVAPLRFSGPDWSAVAEPVPATGGDTDLRRLVDAVRAAHAEAGGAPAPRPWLPELPVLVHPGDVEEAVGDGVLRLGLGIVDVPEEQRQDSWVLDLERDGNLLVLGAAGTGKTSLLRLIAAALARRAEPAHLHLYGIDGGGGGLAAVAQLAHTGAVVRADEAARLERLVSRLRGVVDARRAAPAAAGAPAIVVLVDDYAGFAAAMERVDFGTSVEALTRLVAEGPPVGVRFVITAGRRGALPAALFASLPVRLVLRMADADEFRSAGIEPGTYGGAQLAPGRGFLDHGLEVQVAVLGEHGADAEQVEALAVLAEASRQLPGAGTVPAIQLLPNLVRAADLPAPTAPAAGAPLGLVESDLRPLSVDLANGGLLVTGPPRSGRSTALEVIARGLRTSTPGLRMVLFAPRPSALSRLDIWDETANGLGPCEELAARVAAAADSGVAGPTTVLVIDDGEELAEGPATKHLDGLARRGRDVAVHLVAAVESRSAHRAYAGWIPELRKGRHGLLLQPDTDIDGDLLGVRLPRRGDRPFPPGRGYLVVRGDAEVVQVATPEAAT